MVIIDMIREGVLSADICKVPCPGLACVAMPPARQEHGGFAPA
jgi:hypothetical protein